MLCRTPKQIMLGKFECVCSPHMYALSLDLCFMLNAVFWRRFGASEREKERERQGSSLNLVDPES